MHIIDIIQASVEDIQKSYVISGIVDNTNNTYTITLVEDTNDSLFSELTENEIITIINTVGFDGEYQITDVNEENKTFDITLIKGIVIPGSLGNANRNAPYFYPDYITGVNEYLTALNKSVLGQKMKFPLVLLNLRFKGKVENGNTTIKNLTIYIIGATELNQDNIWEHENSMSVLRHIEEELKDYISTRVCMGLLDYESDEVFYGKKNGNLANSVTDHIMISFTLTYNN